MSSINSNVTRVYGGMPASDAGNIQQTASPTTAGIAEVLVPGTYRRKIMGPKINGLFSIQTFVDSAGGATSAMTIFYSNHPNPSIASDADWVDSGITALDLTSTAGKFTKVTGTNPEWIMLKVVIVTSNASIRVFTRVEGTNYVV